MKDLNRGAELIYIFQLIIKEIKLLFLKI